MTIVGLGHQSLDRTNHMLGYVTSNVRLVCGRDAGPQAFGATSIRRLNLSCMACSLFRPGLQWWCSRDVSRYRGHRACVADAPKWPESGCVAFPPCRHRDLIRSTTIDRVESCLAPHFMAAVRCPSALRMLRSWTSSREWRRSRQRRENPRQGWRRSVRSHRPPARSQ
jgi:hypothetical protein